ncbi:MAG: TRAP transporter small permease [Hyphomicrobiales bacterium]|nr:TRAP transporter small permease [Hyphomicrobiales bacterium]
MSQNTDPAEKVLPRFMLWVASAALVIMMLVTVVDVVLRFAFRIPVCGAYDVVGFGLLIMVFFGAASVIAHAREITIDLIDIMLAKPAVAALKLVASILGLCIFVFLGWSMISPAIDAYRWGGFSLELGVPVWWQWVAAFFGLAGILWVSAGRLLSDARKLRAEMDADKTSEEPSA